jgi:hypothetical protein
MTQNPERARLVFFAVAASYVVGVAILAFASLVGACSGAEGDPAPVPSEASTDTGTVPCTTTTTAPSDGGAG